MNVISTKVEKINGIANEEIKVEHPRISKITFVYEGSEIAIENNLKKIIMDNLKAKKLID